MSPLFFSSFLHFLVPHQGTDFRPLTSGWRCAGGEAIQPDSSQPSRLRWNDPKSELPVLIVINFRGVPSPPCGATVAHPSCSSFRRYQMTVVVFHADNPHVSYLERTPAEKPGHDVLALPGSAFVQVPGVLPNFQPLFEVSSNGMPRRSVRFLC